MLVIAFSSARILRHILRAFFHVVHHRVGNNAGQSYRMSHVLSEVDSAALHVPHTAIVPVQHESVGAVSLRQTTCNVPDVALRFCEYGGTENGQSDTE